MTERIAIQGLEIAREFADFIDNRALPGTGIAPETFWTGLTRMVAELGPKNRRLLEKRTEMQGEIDAWHIANRDRPHDHAAYEAFLRQIGYLVAEGDGFRIDTSNVDPEIARVPGPQLVVPIMNARFALNAANARWGSLYDALYGTDVIDNPPLDGRYDPERGAKVIAWAREFLDQTVPLAEGSWRDITKLRIEDGVLRPSPRNAEHFGGHGGSADNPDFVLLRNNGLHIQIVVDPTRRVGAEDSAGIADIRLESALTTIMDCEDSVAAVDATDKVLAYSNWLGLMKGDLTEKVTKGGASFVRKLSEDIPFRAPDGSFRTLKGRALMLVRNVGHLMTTPTVIDAHGEEIGEGLLDALTTVMIAMHDIGHTRRNSATGSVYVVKPKMHGPEEVRFADETFSLVEDILCLPRNTVKLGLMDEERRTSANLRECIRAAKSRLAFINTGFLDRTGDEIHTSMEAGPMLPKGEMKSTPWIAAYEGRNVDIGLECGLQGKAQIGKGMWAMPDRMKDMLATKSAHPLAGATCAWVPSPTAATLHATHYHRIDTLARQREIAAAGPRHGLRELLTIPLLDSRNPGESEIIREVENNAQGILGYVVRWIDQGIGCSKVPDIDDVGLMEDRATCRISSQALSNWLHHGIVSEQMVLAALQRMAAVVDRQNAADPLYQPMAPDFTSVAFQAACDLVFRGRLQSSGYTEPILHARRLEAKATRLSGNDLKAGKAPPP